MVRKLEQSAAAFEGALASGDFRLTVVDGICGGERCRYTARGPAIVLYIQQDEGSLPDDALPLRNDSRSLAWHRHTACPPCAAAYVAELVGTERYHNSRLYELDQTTGASALREKPLLRARPLDPGARIGGPDAPPLLYPRRDRPRVWCHESPRALPREETRSLSVTFLGGD